MKEGRQTTLKDMVSTISRNSVKVHGIVLEMTAISSVFVSRKKKYDMFAFLSSCHRTPPKLEDNSDEWETGESTADGLLAMKYV